MSFSSKVKGEICRYIDISKEEAIGRNISYNEG